jgi:DNA gyrase subunit A
MEEEQIPKEEAKAEEIPAKELAKEEHKCNEQIVPQVIEDEMKTSYLSYAMSVIVGRALPDVRDGLKPVHRRILFAMHDLGMFHNKPFKKSARIVGEVLGKYHPHGDTAVYDSMVRMAQDWSLRYTLIDGQGNFGSIDGDNAAAMRYTEARLSKISEELLLDIDKETVDFIPNFDASLKEPSVLPAKLPNLIINGSSGIAVGMATNIPPHNLIEVCDGTVALIDNPEITFKELNNYIKGPDFPTGAVIQGDAGIKSAYEFGRGRVKIRAVTKIEENKKKERIIVNELPYQVNKALLIEQIAGLVRDKVITAISDIRDESDRDGIRIVIELKKDSNTDVVINQLYKHSRMQVTFGINTLALVNNEPKTLGLKPLLQNYISHRQIVVRKKTEFELKKAEKKSHILEGLIIALDNIDPVIQKIKASKTAEEAKNILMIDYSLTKIQSQAILDMKLQKLSGLEQDKIRTEHKELQELIIKLKEILSDEQRILNMIKDELIELRDKYGDARKTKIIEGGETQDLDIEDLIDEQECVVSITHSGYIKRLPIDTYKQQNRGGKGVIAQSTKDEDFIENLFIANTHSYLLFFTNKGRVHWLKVYKIPEASRQSRGKAIINLVNLDNDEKIAAFIPVRKFDDQHFLSLITEKGLIKKTNLDAYSRPRQGGINAITLNDTDNLISALLTDGSKQIMIATKNGLACKFDEKNARPIGRTGRGVKGITLRDNDEVIGAVIANNDKTLLSITETGYGKRTKIEDYRLINRGGKGVINIQCSDRNGGVVSVREVDEEDDIMFISQKGIIIRVPVRSISVIGRNTQGMRLMRLSEGDKVACAAKIIKEE